MSQPFAVFDVDGTLVRWQLYHAIGDALASRGLISPEKFTRVKDARMSWKKRAGENSFKEYEYALVKLINGSLKEISVKDYKQAVEEVFNEHKQQVYTYTRDLIRQLKQEGYLLFAISGSPSFIVEKIAAYYGFDDFKSSEMETKGDKFTGRINVAAANKAALLKDLAVIHDVSWGKSIAIGDSEGDIELLGIVEQPIAFNPTKTLYEHAKLAGWPIIIERKNVVYKLISKGGLYTLS